MSIGRDRGKRLERATAKRLNGHRVGVTGLATCDVTAPGFSVECKSRAKTPAWITDAMAQATINATPGTTPIVVLHQTGWLHSADIVMVRMSDWEDIVGEMRREG